jgi:type I site-specific restriction endonuclease
LQSLLKYPVFEMRLKKNEGLTYVFDPIRKKWFVLTPEEWVRQHLINYLVQVKKFPASSISVEKQVQLNDLSKRYDVVVYSKQLQPHLVVECKAPYIELDQSVIDQALRYNLILKADFVMISNGLADYVFDKNNTRIELPNYDKSFNE